VLQVPGTVLAPLLKLGAAAGSAPALPGADHEQFDHN
jgi:hypothetical protein